MAVATFEHFLEHALLCGLWFRLDFNRRFVRDLNFVRRFGDFFLRAIDYLSVVLRDIIGAAVFMISTSTVVIRTGIAPRWIAFLGLLLAVILLIGSFFISWSVAVFPSWVFLISGYILIDNLHGNPLAEGG